MVLLPSEERARKYEPLSTGGFAVTTQGFHYLASDGCPCPFFVGGLCSVYPIRPIDCRMFPLFPLFEIETDSFSLVRAGKYCPLHRRLTGDFVEACADVCHLLNSEMPVEWKRLYNTQNRPRLMDTGASVLRSLPLVTLSASAPHAAASP